MLSYDLAPEHHAPPLDARPLTKPTLMRESAAVVNGNKHDGSAILHRGAPFALEADVQDDHSAAVTPVPFALGVVPWRQNGVLRITVVVKATFLAKVSPMTPAAAPQPYRISDVHHKNQPMARVTAASDRVPKKPRVDVTILGHAHAKRTASVSEMMVRVALKHGDELIFAKNAHVVGARVAKDSAPVPFVRMPIVYERALGGIGTAENPIGCGEEDADDDDRPNILHPEDPLRPIGFGPISAAWPVRKKKLGETASRDVESPLMLLPTDFDFSYFQSAPLDQQIDELPSDALLILEGFDPERERIEITLPGARAMGAIYGLDASDADMGTPIQFRADTLHVDADSWLTTITFRGHVEIPDESRLDQVVVATGIGIGGLDPMIPSLRPPPDRIKPATEVSPAAIENMGGTLMLGHEMPGSGQGLSFAPTNGVSSADQKKRSSETLVLPLSAWSKGPTRHLSTATLALPSDSSALMSPPIAPGPLPVSPPPLMPAVTPAEPEIRVADAPPAMLQNGSIADEPSRRPEEIVDIDRYGFVSALLAERGSKLESILRSHDIDLVVWRKADRFWRQDLRREMAEGIADKLPKFEEAFVRGWESVHPGRFGVEHYARLTIAEKEARIVRELRIQGLDPSLGMRLRRVWRRRLLQDETLKRAFDAALEQKASA